MVCRTLFEVQDQGSTDADRKLKWWFHLLRKVKEKPVDDALMQLSEELLRRNDPSINQIFDLEALSEKYNRLVTFVPLPGEPSDGRSSFSPGRNMDLCTSYHVVGNAGCINNVPDYRSSCWLIGNGNVSLVHER
ncbi:hypothetical protein NPIL_514281 [Nephila pilipes]|uniref:Uncharacterized protein n=1 Tax=Nephila pilipes TaxID=299642 RepID=A0A8X6ULX5_NEPPI|nr:hypothetical protein NPIL_514281 [Nephila pilipes]